MTYRNPILPGSFPDPSICRVGDDYWMVNSSFEFFPALPLHHSRDLANWRYAGHVIDRPECLDLTGVARWSGVWAPTIRHHDGVFYVVWCVMRGVMTNDCRPKNFIARATDPAGPWSDPVPLDDHVGFDPSLFFDADGTAWYSATYVGGVGRSGVFVRPLDTVNLRVNGDEEILWPTGGEGSHIYLIDGRYFILAAAGGTGQGHCVEVAKADGFHGPYTSCWRNPILTHRHLGLQYPISATGHGDLVQAQDGTWWMVLLAKRGHATERDVLGRETFIVPVGWDQGWPLVNPGRGLVEDEMCAPNVTPHPWPIEPARDDFSAPRLGPAWCFLRTPRGSFVDLASRPGFLRLPLRPETLSETKCPAFVCRRLQHQDYAIRVAMDFAPAMDRECAGLALYASEFSHFRLVVTRDGSGLVAQAWQRDREDKEESLVVARPVSGKSFILCAQARNNSLQLSVSEAGRNEGRLLATCDAGLLSDARSWTSNGSWYGCYASSNGIVSANHADFDWCEYRGIDSTGPGER